MHNLEGKQGDSRHHVLSHIEVEWLVLHGLRVSVDTIVETFSLAAELAADVQQVDGHGLMHENKEELQNRLAGALTRFTPSPVALGSGHMDAVSKAAAATHSFALSCDDLGTLSLHLRSCRSLTTDMGTEMSMAQLSIPDFSEFAPLVAKVRYRTLRLRYYLLFTNQQHKGAFPPPVRLPFRSSEAVVLGSGFKRKEDTLGSLGSPFNTQQDDMPLTVAEHDHWLPSAVSVPGALHILHNIAQDVDMGHLPGFQHWYSQLKTVSEFLIEGTYRDRYVVSCLHGSPYQSPEIEQLFKRTPPKLHEKRWGHIIAFLKASKEPLTVMRVTWNADSFLKEGRKDFKGFDVKSLSDILRCEYFFAYTEMVLQLHKRLDLVRKWCEWCPCHSMTALAEEGYLRDPCPMNTLRAPECACGDLFAVFDTIIGEASPEHLLMEPAARLSASDLADLFRAECTAVAAMRLRVRMRTLTRPRKFAGEFLNNQISHKKPRIQRYEGMR